MRLCQRVHLIGSGRSGFSLTDDNDCHVYAVDAGDEIALIDAGGGRSTEALLANLSEDGLDVTRVRHLFLTHAHGDHAAGAAPLCAALERAAGRRPLVYAAPEAAGWLRAGDERAISLDVAREAGVYPPDFVFPACPVDREIKDGDILPFGDLAALVIDTPGHSRGHVAFSIATGDRTCLFAGDALFFGGRIVLQHIWDCSLQESIASIERLAELPWDALLPGHLAISLREGRRHADSAMRQIRRRGVPLQLAP